MPAEQGNPATQPARYLLVLSCTDQPGISLAVARLVFEHGATVTESQQYADPDTGRFFMRVGFEAPDGRELDLAELRSAATRMAEPFEMEWTLFDSRDPVRILIMVSKLGHCLNDLLYRASLGRYNVEVVAVVSNHETLRSMAENAGVPFHHVPVTPDTKPQAEARLLELVDELDVDLVVLARYMQILSDDLCRALKGRAINIHHSMLPSFKGARPYQRAYERGVKVVGATAHYVTADLDEGPIIEQSLTHVNHAMTAEDLTAAGRNTECLALARAVAWHIEHRVLLNGNKTVVFA